MSLPSSNWFSHWAVRAFANAPQSGKIQTRRRRSRRPAQQISLESLEPRQMLSVNPASSGSSASSSTDSSNIAAFVSQNSIGILSTVPGIPTAVVAVSGNAQLAVTWTAPSSTGGSPITDYAVKYSSNGGSTWTNFRDPVSVATSCTVTGLTNGTSYIIKVIAKNAVGISLPSANSARVTPALPVLVPSAPTTVVAAVGQGQLAVTWVAPASPGGSAITDYFVSYSSNAGASWTLFPRAASAATSCTVTGLTTVTPYVIRVVARNGFGISLPSANSASVTPRILMSMVTVGNVGNAADTNTGSVYGAVSYSYQIGTYDVTGSQYTAFLNAVGSTDTYALYNASMGTDPNSYGVAQISRSGTSGSYTYAVLNSTGNRPISYVSWFDCARFSNWMVNGQGSGSTETGAYTLVDGQRTGTAPAANAGASFRIPTENEWFKAAYYKGGSTNAGYWTYATQSNVAPGTATGSGANQANYNNAIGHATDVGSFPGSGSSYGTFDQSGNVFQWNDLAGTAGLSRGLRGGSWANDSYTLSSSNRVYGFDPSNEYNFVSFRLVSGPLVPGVPTAVAAVGRGNAQLAVTWAAPASTGGSPITDYLVKYSSNNGSTWKNFAHPVSTATSCTVAGLTNGTAYVIKVIAKNAGGISLPSVNSGPATPLATALTPLFGTPTSTATGFTVQISNYDSSYTWVGTATASGSVAISGSGLVTVTGVAVGTSSTATITTTKLNTAVGSATVTATSLFFAMSMVTVGNPGNAADNRTGSLYGAVSYSYQIGKYDVTGSQYTAFLNAVGSTDTYGLYNARMGTDGNIAQISRSGTAGTYTYAVMNGTGSRPITYVSWFDSARFSNWMSNGQPSGAQTSTTTEDGAYNVNGATSGNAVAANATNPNTGLAPTFQIPLENEWYKAAYYSPNYGGSGVGGYYAYATQSDSAPGTSIGSSANQASYNGYFGYEIDVGSFSGSGSFYGTFDQSGNGWQWNDLDGTSGSSRGFRGGYWGDDSNGVSSSRRFDYFTPLNESYFVGFRLASPV